MRALEEETGKVPVRLLSVGDVAALLQVPVATIYEWRYRGEGPDPIRIGKYLRFHPDDLARWLEARRVASRKVGH